MNKAQWLMLATIAVVTPLAGIAPHTHVNPATVPNPSRIVRYEVVFTPDRAVMIKHQLGEPKHRLWS
jgi:hypothetical protein